MTKKNTPVSSKGFGLIEVIVATAIISVSLYALTAAAQFAFRIIANNVNETQAQFLAEEGVEVVRALRDESWTTHIEPLAVGTSYYPSFATTTSVWSLVSTDSGPIDQEFERTVTFGDVYRRDSDDDIVPASSSDPKTVDPDTKEITVRVSWGGEETAESVSVSYEDGTTDGNLAAFPSDNAGDGDPAQGFTTPAGSSINVNAVEMLLKRVGTPSDVYAELRAGTTVGAVLGTSDTVTSSAIPDDALTWVRFTFSSPVALDPGTLYYIRLRSTPDSKVPFSGSEGTIHIGYRQADPSPYSGGTAWRYVGRNDTPSDEGQELTQYDYSFRVYEQTSAGGSEAIEVVTYITDLFDN